MQGDSFRSFIPGERMHTRREFIGQLAVAAGAAEMLAVCPESILAALAIEPEAGSSYLDAEHVVILMQENRSFDHAFGTLRGVRGFNDPRAIRLPDGNPVWVQANAAGERYVPFRLNMKDSKSTWMGSLPHGRSDQLDARNHGLYDKWLTAKRSGEKAYANMPLTLGYYTRKDIPFYYALADAFTICDQHFCSSLTPTTPNRLHLWTGTLRERQSADAPANVRNEDVDYGKWASWVTFPERLEEHGISWKIYQNELSLESGLSEIHDAWLTNFGDNPIEWFTQYNVRFAASHRTFRDKRIGEIPGEIIALKKQLAANKGPANQLAALQKHLDELAATLNRFEAERTEWTEEKFRKLSPREQSLHARAFCTNGGDPSYRQLAELNYRDGETKRSLQVPKGDVLHQFRKDVTDGTLPTVSWIVSPEAFSDHPSSAWNGAWYVSEVLKILTSNPNVWKKTVFILTYDENDGYFDHVPPFTPPHPHQPDAGLVSPGLNTALEYVELRRTEKEQLRRKRREGPIGLGYRVPLIIASPWTRGGNVCSQVFDHTSVLQFLEKLLTHKTEKAIEETNISPWRRAVCGDLTAAFQSADDDQGGVKEYLARDAFLEQIHRAKFKELPTGYRTLNKAEIEQIRRDPRSSPLLPRQEAGTRPSCPLPYELAVDGSLNDKRDRFTIRFEAGKDLFGKRAAGAPFVVYPIAAQGTMLVRNYAVDAGTHLEDSWRIDAFDKGRYGLRVYGPNGFFREFGGGSDDPAVDILFRYAQTKPNPAHLSELVELICVNRDPKKTHTIEIRDHAYKAPAQKSVLPPGKRATLVINTQPSFGWYDFSVFAADHKRFEKRYAGRVETGKWGVSDPAMGT